MAFGFNDSGICVCEFWALRGGNGSRVYCRVNVFGKIGPLSMSRCSSAADRCDAYGDVGEFYRDGGEL